MTAAPGDSPERSAPEPNWRPGASLATAERLAALRRAVRAYFDATGALEVVTPLLSASGATEPAIEPFDTRATAHDGHLWLHTSPEFAMKRLVAAWRRDVWQLCPVFRRDERGTRHEREFQLLEWYRVGRDAAGLRADVAALLRTTLGAFAPFDRDPVTRGYGDAVREIAGRWPEDLAVADVAALFDARGRHFPDGLEAHERDAALNLLFDTFVVPSFATDRPTFVTGYPISQASLARLTTDRHGRHVAARFELYAGPVELANGFEELTDADEQRGRFEAERNERAAAGQPVPPLDERFLAALAHGLPACAGVAVGVERLAMVAFGAGSLDEVVAFSSTRA